MPDAGVTGSAVGDVLVPATATETVPSVVVTGFTTTGCEFTDTWYVPACEYVWVTVAGVTHADPGTLEGGQSIGSWEPSPKSIHTFTPVAGVPLASTGTPHGEENDTESGAVPEAGVAVSCVALEVAPVTATVTVAKVRDADQVHPD